MSFLKSIWKGNSKHKKLSDQLKKAKPIEEEQTETQEVEKEAMTFKLKYLGSTVVDKVAGENISPEAVKNVIKVAKAAGKKVQRVNVAISLTGINVTDIKGNSMFEVSIYRISNCSTDKQFRQIFSFISIDSNESMECHVFWCSKRKMAEMVALTVAHAFSTAYETWKISPNANDFPKDEVHSENMKNTLNTMKSNLIENENNMMDFKSDEIIEEKLIDFDDPVEVGINISYTISRPSYDLSNLNTQNQWVCFDDDFANSFDRDNKNNCENSFQCNFSKAFENDTSNHFQSNGVSNYQIDAQRWNNTNNAIGLF